MQELELTRERVASVWWLIAWRVVVGWTVVLALELVIGAIGARTGLPFEVAYFFGIVVAWVLGLAWSFFVVRMALQKRYKEFHLALIKN
jgi:hypothetical protein